MLACGIHTEMVGPQQLVREEAACQAAPALLFCYALPAAAADTFQQPSCSAGPLTHPALAPPPHPPTHTAANLVFWTINLQGSFLLFWLIYLVSLAIGVGESGDWGRG